MNLQLPLKRKWFEMTKAGIKTEDYREITPYWAARFLLDRSGDRQNHFFWEYKFELLEGEIEEIKENITLFTKTKLYTHNTMTLGYPKSTDKERILKLEHKGIEIREGNTEWGAEPGKIYFVIKHGKIIE